MNKIFIFKIVLVVVVLSIPLTSVLAQNKQGVHEPGTGIENPELKQENQVTDQGNGQGVQIQNEAQEQTQNHGDESQIQNGNVAIEQGLERRSRVANAVQAMLEVGERNGVVLR